MSAECTSIAECASCQNMTMRDHAIKIAKTTGCTAIVSWFGRSVVPVGIVHGSIFGLTFATSGKLTTYLLKQFSSLNNTERMISGICVGVVTAYEVSNAIATLNLVPAGITMPEALILSFSTTVLFAGIEMGIEYIEKRKAGKQELVVK